MQDGRHTVGDGDAVAGGDYRMSTAAGISDIAKTLHDRASLRGNVLVCWCDCDKYM